MKILKNIILVLILCGMSEVVKAMQVSKTAVNVIPAAQVNVVPVMQLNTQVVAQPAQHSVHAQLRRNTRSCGLALIWVTLASLLQSAKAQIWF